METVVKERNRASQQKQFQGQFIRDIEGISDKENTWKWLEECRLKKKSESLSFAAKEQAIRTNNVRVKIDKPLKTVTVDSFISRRNTTIQKTPQ